VRNEKAIHHVGGAPLPKEESAFFHTFTCTKTGLEQHGMAIKARVLAYGTFAARCPLFLTMSRSDTDTDVIDVSRPRYTLGREVSFSYDHRTGEILTGKIASSKQIIHGANSLTVTYDIQSSGMTFTNVPEENIVKKPWPTKIFSRLAAK